MIRPDGLSSIATGHRQLRRPSNSRRHKRLRPWLQPLEDRTLLSTITWSTTAAPNGGNWDVGSNWVGGVAPGSNDSAVINFTTAETVTVSSTGDSVQSVTTNNDTTFSLSGSLSLGSGSSTFDGPVNISSTGSLTVASGASVLISNDNILTNNGSLSFGSGDTVTLGTNGYDAEVADNGTMSATNATFTATNSSSSVTVNSGGTLSASGSTFNVTLFVPITQVHNLTNNTSFQQIQIESGTLSGTTVNLNSIGTNTAKLEYVFSSTFMISSTGVLDVGSNVPVLITNDVTVTNSGTLSFSSGDVVTFGINGYDGTLADNGSLTATGTTFTATSSQSSIMVNSGGTISPTGSIFNLTLYVPILQVTNLTNNTSFNQIQIDTGTLSGTTVNLNLIGTNTSKLEYVFSSTFSISSTGVLNVGSNVPVLITNDVTVTNSGTLSFSSGDVVTFGINGYDGILADNGSLTATGTTFTATSSQSSIMVNNGGTISPTGSIFNLTLYVPILQVTNLTNNTSFNQIQIDTGTLSGTTVNLNLIGTNTSNLEYVFSSTFSISSTGVLNFGSNVPELITNDVTVTNSGTLSFGSGDVVTFGINGYDGILADNGNMAATGTTFTATSGQSSIMVNNGGTISPTGSIFNLTLYVPILQVTNLTNNTSFDQIQIDTGTLSGTTVALNLIGTNTANLEYVFSSTFSISSTGVLNFGSNVPVLITNDVTVTNSGTLSFGSGDVVTFGINGYDGILANGGNMIATGTTFAATSSQSSIMVSSVGTISPTGSIFNLPLYVPYNDIPNLTNNVSFKQIELDAGTLSTGPLDLDLIGSNTTNLSYVFSANFLVAPGGILNFGPNVPVSVTNDITFTDNGTVSFASGDTLSLSANGYYGIIVVGGNLAIGGTSVTGTSANSAINVNSGGVFSASDTSFGEKQLTFNSGSNDTLQFTTVTGHITINSGATINIAGNDFSGVGKQGVIAAGTSTATIDLEENYWGATDSTTIENLIDDHHISSTLPTIAVSPVWATNSGTIATPQTVYFSPVDQKFNLSATVSTTGGIPITGGTETFTILNGAQQVGQTTSSGTVANGTVSASYTLPGGTPIGTYTIEAAYSGSGGYPASSDTSQILTVSKAPASQVAITTAPLSQVAGSRGQITLQLEDTYGNTGATSSVPQTISLNTTSGGGAFYAAASGGTPITSVVIAAGQTSATVYYFDTVVGNPTVTGSDNALNSAPSQTEAIRPAAASKVEITSSPLTLTAGSIGAVIVVFEDQYNNPGATSTTAQTIDLFTTSPQGLFYAGQSGGTRISSVVIPIGQSGVTFYYGDTVAGGPTITADDNAIGSAFQRETILSGPASQLAIASVPFEATVGEFSPLTVQLEDAYNNPAATSTNAQTITLSTTSTGGAFYASASSATPISSVVIPVGQSSTTVYYDDVTVGDPTVKAADTALGSPVTQSEVIVAAPANKVAIGSAPLSLIVGATGLLTVQLEDTYGNPATSSTAQTVTLATTSSLGAFYASRTSSTPITSIVVPAEQKSVTVYYSDDQVGTPLVTVDDSSLSSTANQQETVNATGVATKLAITSQALTSVAGKSGALTISLEDAAGDLGATSPIDQTVSLGTTSVDGLFYATSTSSTAISSAVIPAGQTSVTVYYQDTLAGTPTVNASDTTLNASSPQQETITPSVATHLVYASSPLVQAAGTRGEVTVGLADQFGNLGAISTSAQSIVPETTSVQGVFYATVSGGTPVTSVAIPAGQTSVNFWYVDTKSGTPTVTASDSGLGSAPVQQETIVASTAKTVVITGYPTKTTAGVSNSLTVTVFDDYNNVDTSYTGTVEFSSSDGQSTPGAGLPVDYAFTTGTGGDDGVHTFSAALKTAAPQSITVTDTANSGLTGSQTGINVVPAPATQLKIVGKPPIGVIAGISFSTTVYAEDPYNNTDTTFGGQISVGLTSGTGSLTGTTSMNAVEGVAAFNNLIATASGPIAIGATSNNLSSDSAGGVTVSPAAADHFVVTTSFTNPDVAGSVGTVTVTAKDHYGNVADSGQNQYLGTVDLASTDPLTVNLPSNYAFTASDAGSHTFQNVVLETAGSQTISATDLVNHASAGSTTVDVVPAAVTDFVLTTSFANPDVAGTVGSVSVTAKDNYGNTVGSGPNHYLGTVDLSTTDDQAVDFPARHSFVAGDAGAFTFTAVALRTSGSQTITAADVDTNSINGHMKITVAAAQVKDLVVTTSFASPDVAGTVGTVSITAVDAYNNPVASGPNQYVGTVNLSNTDSIATGLPSSYPFTASDAGSHTFSAVDLMTAGSQTITATDTLHAALTASATVDVVPAMVKDFVVTTGFANPDVAGTMGSVTVTATDSYGNTVGSGPNLYLGAVDLSTTDDQAANVPVSHAFAAGDAGVYTFTGVALRTSGTQTITAADANDNTVTGDVKITVVAANVQSLRVTTSFASPDVAGTVGTVTISALDAYNNLVASGPNTYEGMVNLADTASIIGTGLPSSYSFTAGDAGSHTFNDLVLKPAGGQSISATDTVVSDLTASTTVDVVPAAAANFVVTASFANPDVAGTSGTVIVTVKDAYGNTLGSGPNQYAGTVNLSGTDSQSVGLPASHAFSRADAGTYMFTDVVLKTAGVQTIKAVDSVHSSVTGSAIVTVSAAPAADLVVTTPPPSPLAAGEDFTIVVSAEDPFHNVDTSFNGSVTISLPGGSSSTSTVQARNGVATFSGLSIPTSGQVSGISATSGTLGAGTTGPITVNPPSSGGGGSPTPALQSEQVATTQKLKKGKKVGKPVFSGFRFQFNMPVNITGASINVYSTTAKKVKKKPVTTEKPVSFTPSYDPATNTVILTLKSTTPFAKSGGEITISGVMSEAGTVQSPSELEFIITKNAKAITER